MRTRREVLRAAGGAMMIVLGGIQVACSREDATVIESLQLGDAELLTLVAMVQRLLPHEDLDPVVYRDAVQVFMQSAAENPAVIAGLAELESLGFLDLSVADQVAALAAIETTPFFNVIRDAAIRGIYSDKRTWQLLGYDGDASRFGGYIDRGFNDIDWLPNVTPAAEGD